MRITFEIADEEVQRVLAPFMAGTSAPVPDVRTARAPAMMRIAEAAQHLDISRNSIYQLIARGDLPSLKIGRSIRIPVEALTTFIREEALRQKTERERVSAAWAPSWSAPSRTAARPLPADTAPPARRPRPRKEKLAIDLSPKPRPAETTGWTRDDHIKVLSDMEKGGWPAELTGLMLEDWDAGLHRTYVLRAADIAELLLVSKSTVALMIRRGQIPSFTPEPIYRSDKPVALVSVLDYQRFVDARPASTGKGRSRPPRNPGT